MVDSIISPSDGIHQKRKNLQELCPLTIQHLLKITASTEHKCIFLHYPIFTKYNLLIHHNANLIASNYIL